MAKDNTMIIAVAALGLGYLYFKNQSPAVAAPLPSGGGGSGGDGSGSRRFPITGGPNGGYFIPGRYQGNQQPYYNPPGHINYQQNHRYRGPQGNYNPSYNNYVSYVPTGSRGGAKLVSAAGKARIQGFEPFSAVPVPDPSGGGVTMGYGHYFPAGTQHAASWTQAQALAHLNADLGAIEHTINQHITNQNVALTQNELDALADLIFTIGSGAFAGSTILTDINAGNFSGAQSEFGHWVFAGNPPVTMPGLVTRRASDAALWGTGIQANLTS